MTKFWNALRYIPMPRWLYRRVQVRWLNSMPPDVRRELLLRSLRAAFPEFARFEDCIRHYETL